MNELPIYITRDDQTKLRLLLSAISPGSKNHALDKLRQELDRAQIVETSSIAPNVVTMGSRVQITDTDTAEVEEYTLTFPERADVDKKQLSVLAPVGTAILGYREGDEVSWSTPGGLRRIKILRVDQANPLPADHAAASATSR